MLVYQLNKLQQSNKQTRTSKPMTSHKEFKDNPHLVFTQADKNHTTVVIDKSDYEEKKLRSLDDSDYKKITPSPFKIITTSWIKVS